MQNVIRYRNQHVQYVIQMLDLDIQIPIHYNGVEGGGADDIPILF